MCATGHHDVLVGMGDRDRACDSKVPRGKCELPLNAADACRVGVDVRGCRVSAHGANECESASVRAHDVSVCDESDETPQLAVWNLLSVSLRTSLDVGSVQQEERGCVTRQKSWHRKTAYKPEIGDRFETCLCFEGRRFSFRGKKKKKREDWRERVNK